MMVQSVVQTVQIRPGEKGKKGMDKKALENFLMEAIMVCRRIRKDESDAILGFKPSMTLNGSDLLRLIAATSSLEEVFRHMVENYIRQPVDISIESICSCELTTARLRGANIRMLSDMMRIDRGICLAMFRLAEKAGAERQWHMLALAS